MSGYWRLAHGAYSSFTRARCTLSHVRIVVRVLLHSYASSVLTWARTWASFAALHEPEVRDSGSWHMVSAGSHVLLLKLRLLRSGKGETALILCHDFIHHLHEMPPVHGVAIYLHQHIARLQQA